MASQSLLELDSLTIQVIVDNELDPISPSPNPQVTQSGGIFTIGMTGPDISHQAHRGGAGVELRMDNICCGAHGLSLLITGRRGDETHTVLFDTGPEEQVFERNATRLGLKDKVGEVEDIVLSHWHRDHSGGMLKAIAMVQAAKKNGGKAVRADLHPARPTYRGVQPPNLPVVSMEADPTFAEIEGVGGKVVKSDQPHLIGGDMFMVSGEILRETEYERGLRFGVRFDADAEGNGKWEVDEKMADERFLMCNIKGKGIVMFTGCSHAGVVNASRQSTTLRPNTPLYAVMGGFHLADAEKATIASTAQDLKALDTKVLLTGHCTGWRAKFELQRVFPEGCLVPSFVGTRFDL